jgi:tetratricopeptide (TPR) repeat protein
MMKKIITYILLAGFAFVLVSSQQSRCADLDDGIEAYENGEYDQAIELINQYIQEKPRDEKAYYFLGRCYFEMGDFDQAIEEYRKALNVSSKYWQAYYGLGQAFLEKDNYDEAERAFQDGLSKKDKPEFYNGLGLVQLSKGMLKEADYSFRKAISMDEKNPEYHKNLGDVNFEKGVLVIAMQEYQTALELDSTMVEVYFNLAQAYLKQVRFNDAMEAFKAAIRVDPENKEAYLRLGEIYMLDGKHFGEARVIYEEYFKFGLDNAEAYRNLGISYYHLSRMLPSLVIGVGDTLTRESMAQRASDYLQKSLNLDTSKPEAYLYLGESYQSQKKYQEALDAFLKYEQALLAKGYEWTAKDAEFWVNKGQVQAELGDSASLEAAIVSLTKAIERTFEPGIQLP